MHLVRLSKKSIDMKTYFITCFFLLTVVSLNSQGYWNDVFDLDDHSYITSNAILKDSIIIVGGYANGSSCEYPVLFTYDFKGNRLWALTIGSDAICADNDYIYITAYNIGNDDVVDDDFLNITKLDESGNIIFNYNYDLPEYWDIDPSTKRPVSIKLNNGIILTNISEFISICVSA